MKRNQNLLSYSVMSSSVTKELAPQTTSFVTFCGFFPAIINAVIPPSLHPTNEYFSIPMFWNMRSIKPHEAFQRAVIGIITRQSGNILRDQCAPSVKINNINWLRLSELPLVWNNKRIASQYVSNIIAFINIAASFASRSKKFSHVLSGGILFPYPLGSQAITVNKSLFMWDTWWAKSVSPEPIQ